MIAGKYWDANDILSYNANISAVFACREIGKSYGELIRGHARRIRNHEGMLWLRFTQEAADGLAKKFGDGKWWAVWDQLHIDPDNVKRVGRRILMRDHEGAPWLPLIRYAGLSEWANLRDTDDPAEKFIFFDEFIVPDHTLKCYTGGEPWKNLLDLWISMRRGSDRCPILLAGNPELGVDWLLPALGIKDRQTPERVRIYRPSDYVRDMCKNDKYDLDRVAVLWTTNPGGQSAGGAESGIAQKLPDGLQRRRSGSERFYCQFDFGEGPFAVYYTRDGFMICEARENPAERIVKQFPDGSRRCILFSPTFKQSLDFLRMYWRAGRVKFSDPLAFSRFKHAAPKIV